MSTPTLGELLDDERSEVFALDLHRGDVVVLTYPEGTREALQVLDVGPRPAGPGVWGWWARVVDLHTMADDERAAELLAAGSPVALAERSRLCAPEDCVFEIVGAGIIR